MAVCPGNLPKFRLPRTLRCLGAIAWGAMIVSSANADPLVERKDSTELCVLRALKDSTKDRESSGRTNLHVSKSNMADQIQEYWRIEGTIRWCDTNLFRNLKKPTGLGIFFSKDASPVFDWKLGSISMRLEPKSNSISNQVEGAHEYAHAIFYENLDRYSDEFRSWRTARERYVTLNKSLVSKLEREIEALSIKKRDLSDYVNRNPSRRDAVKPRIDEVRQRISQVTEELLSESDKLPPAGDDPKILKTSAPYDEVWADVVGILRAGTPEKYREVLFHEAQIVGISKPVTELQMLRSFSDDVPIRGWNKKLKVVPKDMREHLLLNPARSWLFRKVLSKKYALSKLNELMPVILEVLAQEAVWADRALETIDAESLNAQLIERMKSSLGSAGFL